MRSFYLKKFVFLFLSMLACEIIKAKHRQVSMVTLSACCGGEIALSHSYGSFSHDNVGEPKQWKGVSLVYQKQKGKGTRNNSVCTLIIAHPRYIKISTCFRGFSVKIGNFHDSIVSQFPEKILEHKENQTKYRKMTRKPKSHVRILKRKYRTWAIIKTRKRG